MSIPEVHLRSIEIAVSEIGGKDSSLWSIRPQEKNQEGYEFEFVVDVRISYVKDLTPMLVTQGAAPTEQEASIQDYVQYSFRHTFEDEFAALDHVRDLTSMSDSVHIMCIYETSNSEGDDPFTILFQGDSSLTIQTGNGDKKHGDAYDKALNASGLCASVAPEQFGDFQIVLNTRGTDDLHSTFLQFAKLHDKLQRGT